MFVLGMTCIGAAFSSSDMLLVLVAILFILNLASACQDISVDSLALHILKEEELGIGNTVQVKNKSGLFSCPYRILDYFSDTVVCSSLGHPLGNTQKVP